MNGSPGAQVTRRQSIADRWITMMTAPRPIPCSLEVQSGLAQAPVLTAGVHGGRKEVGPAVADPIALPRTANAEVLQVDTGL